jgi:adenylate cyclase
MVEPRTNRRLAAILAADVVGYSRMMARDEAGTLAAMKRHRDAVFDPAVAQHNGRIVKLMGDGTLVEFGSVVDAVNCALAIQRTIATETAAGPPIVLRIGVNLGDIVVDGDDIYGDGVNVAARLEPLAEAGGICVASIVNDSIGGRVDVAFTDSGEVQVKNIDRPIRIWKWHPTSSAGSPSPTASPQAERGVLPSLAVLPFHNLSGDATQDYFADGIVDDLITALSRFKTFAVTSRNSSFVYKGRAVDVREIGRELGVRYVLEGSIRRSGSRLRVTAQLVDTATAGHLWAQNYDGALEDVFEMQDRITESVVSIVEPMVKRAEIERTRLKPPTSLDAYDLYLKAMALVLTTEPGATAHAIELIERSLVLDPSFPPAIAIAATAYLSLYDRQVLGATEETRRKGLEYARAALAVAGSDANIRVTGGIGVIMLGGEYESGLAAIRQATSENPNSVNVLGYAGVGALWASEVEEAEGYFLRALRLNPNDHSSQWALTRMAHIRLLQGRFEEALDWASRSYAVSPSNAITHSMLVAANAFLGRLEDAARWTKALRKVSPETTFASIRRGCQMMRDQRQVEVVIEGLRLGGMPENEAAAPGPAA